MGFSIWFTLFWVSYFTWLLFEAWVFSRDRRAVAGRKTDGGSIVVLIGFISLALFIAFVSPHWFPSARIAARSPLIPAVALVFIWGGMAFRLRAIQTLGSFFRTTVTIQDEHRLVVTGPYRILRHPGYTGAMITISGFGLYMNNWVSFVGAFAIALLGYSDRMSIEESTLDEKFGTVFQEHRARTWAIIPLVW